MDQNKKVLLSITSLIGIFIFTLITAYTVNNSIPKSNSKIDVSRILGVQTEKVLVKRVVDGDTVELQDGRKVRYIGINTPETVHPNKKVECFGKEASSFNKKLVEGKVVELEKDVSEVDRYGRLLRYVYVNGLFVNEYLVREGYANVSTFPPDVKYKDLFLEAEREARDGSKGFWSKCR